MRLMKNKRGKKANSHFEFEITKSLLNSKRSQLTVFVIIALVIVGVVLALLLPKIKSAWKAEAPDVELEKCILEDTKDALELVMAQGGSANPKLYYSYMGEPIDYLCYTRDYFKRCVMQKPMLKQDIEAEIGKLIQPIVNKCASSLVENLKSKGYAVSVEGTKKAEVTIVPENVKVSIDLALTTEKDGLEEPYSGLGTDFKSEAYDLIMVALSIANWETRYGDAVPELYMGYYHSLQVEKKKQSDETTIYIITNLDTEEVLRFASRSNAWAPGYAV